jgi:hypothetical protein
MHVFAHSAVVHTCHTPDCMNFLPVLQTQRSVLYNRQPLHIIATHKYYNTLIPLGGLGMVTG